LYSVLLVTLTLLGVFDAVVPDSSESVYDIELSELCSFLKGLYRELGPGYGCVVESPVVENSTCYTSTNMFTSHVLRNLCSDSDLALRIEKFLSIYRTDFYDYYQVLLDMPIELPFKAVTHVVVANVSGVVVKHVKVTNSTMHDYDEYANLVAIKAIYYARMGDEERAREELRKLSKMFDGVGFKDKAFNGLYETYKLALAAIAYRALGDVEEAEKYIEIIKRVKPLTTLYTRNLTGVGDLNTETASLVIIALYSNNPIQTVRESTTAETMSIQKLIALVLLIVVTILLLLTKQFKRWGSIAGLFLTTNRGDAVFSYPHSV